MGNYHVPFWRAVEEATPSLTLIIKNRVTLDAGIHFPHRKRTRRAVGHPVLKAQLMSDGIPGVTEKHTPYCTQLV